MLVEFSKFKNIVLQAHGLPPFPVTKVPPQTEWWKEPLIIFPDSAKRRVAPGQFGYHKPRNLILNEGAGIPNSGKSTTLLSVTKDLEQAWAGERVVLDIHDDDDGVITYGSQVGIATIDENEEVDYLPIGQKKEWDSSLLLQVYKVVRWQKFVAGKIASATAIPDKRHVCLNYRAPIDSLIWTYALAAHKTDPSFVVPAEHQPTLQNCAVDFLQSAALIDALIVFCVSQETAKTRRKEKTSLPRWVTDSPMFGEQISWWSYFLKDVFPLFHGLLGMGLLVVNGEESISHNRQIVSEYIIKSVEVLA